MDQILQYQRLSEVKPRYYKVSMPYHKPTMKRIKFNLKETEMYFDHKKQLYRESTESTESTESQESHKKKGGSSKSVVYVSDIESLIDDL